MSRMVIDIDDGLLAEATRVFGTGTVGETVETALRDVRANRWLALASEPCATTGGGRRTRPGPPVPGDDCRC